MTESFPCGALISGLIGGGDNVSNNCIHRYVFLRDRDSRWGHEDLEVVGSVCFERDVAHRLRKHVAIHAFGFFGLIKKKGKKKRTLGHSSPRTHAKYVKVVVSERHPWVIVDLLLKVGM